ncbi:hypothetical protein [Bradyrhizobium sp. BWC-3-1]|uniref:hypothetical protein n=1 Tax=Bradyrhizobium sp. BWC-3-1 TaxID=3080012 RepID=UPI00293E7D09|nr:hypothetical protein [Bradyrhizobium sp. BWC-3-1]WOH59465.1 hypothetical protein RX329_04890 [Bradyrhizobium sp. BWC-3-1]
MANTITFNVTDPVLAMQVAELIARYEGKGGAPGVEQSTESQKPLVGITNGRRIEVPHGEQLWHNYLGTDLYATVENGMIRFGDQIYDTPSKAALVAGQTVSPSCNTPNGYKWWNVKRDGRWVPIEKLTK